MNDSLTRVYFICAARAYTSEANTNEREEVRIKLPVSVGA
jgi:hypothetical protein